MPSHLQAQPHKTQTLWLQTTQLWQTALRRGGRGRNPSKSRDKVAAASLECVVVTLVVAPEARGKGERVGAVRELNFSFPVWFHIGLGLPDQV